MKITKYLISFVLLVICTQSIETKDVFRRNSSIDEPKCDNALIKSEHNLRDLRDIWNKIKETAISSWHHIKNIAALASEKIKTLIENIKDHAIDIKNTFEEKLYELREKLKFIIKDIYGTRELVKLCIAKEQEHMEEIVKEIMAHMGQCIAEEIGKLTNINRDEPEGLRNKTDFFRGFDERVELCQSDLKNAQECISKVREDIFESFIIMELDILDNHYDKRNIIDDFKGTLVTCSINNLINATNLISAEIIETAKCVLEAKDDEQPELENEIQHIM